MFWFAFFLWIAITVAVDIIRPKPSFENARPKSLGDFQFPTATEGRALPLIWGKVKISGPNIIWYGDFHKWPKTDNVKTGMFSDQTVILGYWYYVGMQFGLCHGVVDSLGWIWINDKRVRQGPGAIEAPDLFGGEEAGSGGVVGQVDFFTGTLTQSVSSYLTAFQSPQPAYRGTCYALFRGGGRPLVLPKIFNQTIHGTGYIGMSNNVAPWAFELTRIPDGLSMATTDPGAEAPNTYDANPMNVLYEILTNTDWGLGISSAEVDITNFRDAASILADEGNGFSMVVDSATEVHKLIEEVQRQIDGSLFYNRSLGLWQVSLARDDYDPGLLTTYDESTIVELKEFTRRTWEETTNQVRVAYVDRSGSTYKDTFALAQDAANIDIQGQTVQSDVSYPGVKVGALANSLAWRDLRALSFPLAKLVFTVNRTAFALAPGAVFKFSWASLGTTGTVFRVMKINYGKFGESVIEVHAVQDVFGTDIGTFGAPITTGWEDPEADPVAPLAVDSLVLEAPRQITVQDPYSATLNPRVWMGARFPGGGTMLLKSYNRTGTSQPIGTAYDADSVLSNFLLVGTLTANVPAYGSSATRPATSYNIEVDEVDPLLSIVEDGGETLVQDLTTIAWCDGEWFGFQKVTDQGGGVFRLEKLHRGLFNSAPKDHLMGAKVWFMSTGGSLTKKSIPASHDEMDIQLRALNAVPVETAQGLTPELEVTLVNLYLCPLAPRDPIVNNAYAPASEDVDTSYPTETGRTGDDALAMEVEVTPRDHTVDDPIGDTALRPTDWLAEDPQFDFHLSLDPDGTPANTPVTTISATETPTAYILRNDVIIAVGANRVIPATGRIVVLARHTVSASTYTNPYDMELDLAITSALQGADDITHGAVDNTASTAVIYGETGNYSIDIKTALPSSGILQAQVNGGGWSTVVAAAATTGLLAITAGDSVELRTQTAKPAANQYFDVTGPTAELGYGVLLS